LSLLEARIFFVDNVQPAFSANYLAVGTSFLYGCSDFHNVFILLAA